MMVVSSFADFVQKQNFLLGGYRLPGSYAGETSTPCVGAGQRRSDNNNSTTAKITDKDAWFTGFRDSGQMASIAIHVDDPVRGTKAFINQRANLDGKFTAIAGDLRRNIEEPRAILGGKAHGVAGAIRRTEAPQIQPQVLVQSGFSAFCPFSLPGNRPHPILSITKKTFCRAKES